MEIVKTVSADCISFYNAKFAENYVSMKKGKRRRETETERIVFVNSIVNIFYWCNEYSQLRVNSITREQLVEDFL